MNIEKAYICIPDFDSYKILKKIERYGRVCYKSENKFNYEDKENNLVNHLVTHGHTSVLEHEKLTFLFVIDRGVSHELVRHRMASYSQESTRYCNYSKEKFGKEITVIKPIFFKGKLFELWKQNMKIVEKNYFTLLELGATPEEARNILPNSLKTEIVSTMNIRSLRNFLSLRSQSHAHPQIKEIAIPLLLFLQSKLNPLFADINYDKSFSKKYYAKLVFTNDFFETTK